MQRINKNNLREFLNSDKAILMACIGIAFVFWLFTKLSKNYRSEVAAEINYTVPLSKISSLPLEKELDVIIEGKGWDLLFHSFFRSKTPEINLVLQDTFHQKINMLSVKTKMRRFLPSEVNILSINPEEIEIYIDEKVQKEIPIRLIQNITLAPQQQIVIPAQIVPAQVSVTGPASIVENINEWKTKLLKLENLDEDVLKGRIEIQPFNNSQVSFKPNILDYGMKVEPFTEKKVNIPIEIINPPNDSVVISKRFVTVTCTVSMSEYENFKADSFKATLDFNTAEALKGSELTIRLTNRDRTTINLLSYEPKKVQFFVLK